MTLKRSWPSSRREEPGGVLCGEEIGREKAGAGGVAGLTQGLSKDGAVGAKLDTRRGGPQEAPGHGIHHRGRLGPDHSLRGGYQTRCFLQP